MINSKHLRASFFGIVTAEEARSAAWKQEVSCFKGDGVHLKYRPQCEYKIGSIQAGESFGKSLLERKALVRVVTQVIISTIVE